MPIDKMEIDLRPQPCIWNNPLPEGWRAARLSDVFDRVTRKKKSENLPILTISSKVGFMTQEERYSRFMAGESLKRYTELHYGEFAYNKGNSKTYPHGCVFPLEDYQEAAVPHVYFCFSNKVEIDRNFYAQYFASGALNTQLAGINNSGVRNDGLLNISAHDFFNVDVPFPPLPEQIKIATILNRIDDAIEATQAVIDQTRRVKQGMMQQLLTRGIEHTRFKQTEIGEIPEEWETGFLKEFCEQICVGFVGACEKYYCTTGIPMIRTGNLKEGFLDVSKMKYVTNDFHRKQKKSQIKPEDLLIARHGNHGQACLVPKSLSEANCLNIVIVRASKDYFNPLFLQYLFNSKSIRQNIESRSSGSTQKVINTSEIARTIFPKPSLHEQKEIAETIQSIDHSINLENDKLQSLYSMKRGLMQDLLTGRVRVKLDGVDTT